jgi:hypothetical protein
LSNVYAAGQITGLDYKGATDWRNYVQGLFDRLSGNITVLDPMRGKAFLKEEDEIGSAGYENQIASEKGITNRDRRDVMNSDALLVYLDGADRVSIGTMIELGWADSARIPVIIVMDENNLHQHAMVREIATYIVPSLERAVELVTLMLDPRAGLPRLPTWKEEVSQAWHDGWIEGIKWHQVMEEKKP